LEAGKRTVVVYTSDHAEAFREHGQMGHTFSIFDEEVKVPAWIDAPKGTLTSEEARHLADKAHEFTFHPDLTATLLDLMGVLDEPALHRFESRMWGVSLLRERVNERAIPMTNCAGVWSCAFENWGVMQRGMKLGARSWDEGWQCFDLARDPFEKHDLGVSACRHLMPVALGTFKRLPGRQAD
jgi:arylsulfatase A-like enzyme